MQELKSHRIKTFALVNKHYNVFMGNTYFWSVELIPWFKEVHLNSQAAYISLSHIHKVMMDGWVREFDITFVSA